MDIDHKDDGRKGAFYVEHENELLAELTYVWTGADGIIIDHTVVNQSLKGRGIGRQLVEKAVEFAREKGIKIIPLCPFARSVLQKNDEFNDVL